MRNITDQKFGMLTAVRPTEHRSYGSVVWEFKCECGKSVIRSLRTVQQAARTDAIISCGCKRSETLPVSDNIIGRQFGKLKVISIRRHAITKRAICLCMCTCGDTVESDLYDLTRNRKRSCGVKCRSFRPKLAPGLSNAKQIYGTYRIYAARKNITFDLTFEDFLEVTSQPCVECMSPPSVSWHSVSDKGRNGLYVHSKIAYIDPDLGYTKENIVSVCIEHVSIYAVDHRGLLPK